MPNYHFQLQPVDTDAVLQEWVSAQDDDEAKALAEIRLLLGKGFSRVTVTRTGMDPIALQRDRPPSQRQRLDPPR